MVSQHKMLKSRANHVIISLTAVVMLKSGCQASDEEIRDFCRRRLASYQVPKSVIFVDRLPRDLAYGKIDRKKLIRTYSNS